MGCGFYRECVCVGCDSVRFYREYVWVVDSTVSVYVWVVVICVVMVQCVAFAVF